MKKALIKWNWSNEQGYESAILITLSNGNRGEAKEMFQDMPLQKRKDFVKNCLFYWITPNEHKIFFFNLLLGYSK